MPVIIDRNNGLFMQLNIPLAMESTTVHITPVLPFALVDVNNEGLDNEVQTQPRTINLCIESTYVMELLCTGWNKVYLAKLIRLEDMEPKKKRKQ